MYKPFDFDPLKKYPIVLYVYPGPQTESVTKTFNPRSNSQALAQFGFIVVEVGNRGGNPQRSKWYHNYGYGNLRDYGLADKKAAVEQLARRHPFIDVNKVGIWGHSAAGSCRPPPCWSIGLLQGGGVRIGESREQYLQQHLEREAPWPKELVGDDGQVTFDATSRRIRAGQELERPPDAVDRRHRQQRPSANTCGWPMHSSRPTNGSI